jgi:hypothetical protein
MYHACSCHHVFAVGASKKKTYVLTIQTAPDMGCLRRMCAGDTPRMQSARPHEGIRVDANMFEALHGVGEEGQQQQSSE